jgi:hypothetical protein
MSGGTLQPHHAFRQTVTPFEAYYQGGQTGQGSSARSFATGAAADYSGYQGYNNNLQGYNAPPATNFPAAYGNSGVASPATGSYGSSTTSLPATYNYQPVYSGGFSSGSC